MLNELSWIKTARSYVGLKENKEKNKSNPEIMKMFNKMGTYNGEHKNWFDDDSTPWCGTFVGYCLGENKRYVVKNWFRALAWADSKTMLKLDKPAYGCIVVFNRSGGGHVGFCVGVDKNDNLMILGGNQGDEVNIKAFKKDRVVGYFWPSIPLSKNLIDIKEPLKDRYNLEVFDKSEISTNEQ